MNTSHNKLLLKHLTLTNTSVNIYMYMNLKHMQVHIYETHISIDEVHERHTRTPKKRCVCILSSPLDRSTRLTLHRLLSEAF